MKRLTFLTLVFSMHSAIFSQSVDSTAIVLLDRMSAVIGELEACTFHITTSIDKPYALGTSTITSVQKVYISGPDKLHLEKMGSRGHFGIWFNESQISYYSYSENNFVVVDAPPTLLGTFDSIYSKYGIEFPAADFFYPTLTDDILENFDNIKYLGSEELGGISAFHILASNSEMNVQIWIANDGINLPVKYVIHKHDGTLWSRYEGEFKKWQMNPNLPDAIFQFTAPPGARQIAILQSREKTKS